MEPEDVLGESVVSRGPATESSGTFSSALSRLQDVSETFSAALHALETITCPEKVRVIAVGGAECANDPISPAEYNLAYTASVWDHPKEACP